MKRDYSVLKDELALTEIRKHKWIESEKKGQEIGFATAAYEWIKKYSLQWQRFRSGLAETEDLFFEKRRHRRFYRQLPIQLKIDDKNLDGHTYDISLMGISCTIPEPLAINSVTKVKIHLPVRDQSFPKFILRFQSYVLRILENKKEKFTSYYKVFLPFNEETRNYLRAHPEFLSN